MVTQLELGIDAQIDTVIEKSKERILKTEAKDNHLVQKKFKELELSLPDDEYAIWVNENTIRRKFRDFAESELMPMIASHSEAAIIEGYQTADELLRLSLQGDELASALINNTRQLEAQLRQDALRKPLADLVGSMPDYAIKALRQAAILGEDFNLDDLFLSYAKHDRTATFTAYRSAKLATYRSNSHIVNSWVWHSAANERTCAVCWAKHGSVHPLDEEMSSHVNCRCSMVPKTKTWKELGFNVPDDLETSINVEEGESLFSKQDLRTKQLVLGPTAYKAYERGEITLNDFVGYRSYEGRQVPYKKSNRVLGITN
ncbi:MAG: phage minor head protein [Thermomicrobiales bacterium]